MPTWVIRVFYHVLARLARQLVRVGASRDSKGRLSWRGALESSRHGYADVVVAEGRRRPSEYMPRATMPARRRPSDWLGHAGASGAHSTYLTSTGGGDGDARTT